jgi:hypothetical protein
MAIGAHSCCKKVTSPTGKKEKQDASCCVDCPLCYVVTFQPVCRFEYMSSPGQRIYTMMPADNLSEYARSHWKPPNAPLLS